MNKMKLLEKYSIQKTDDIDREKFNLIWDMFYHDGYKKFREIDQDEYWEEYCRKTEIHKTYPIIPSEVFLPILTIMEVVPKENYFPEVREIKL